MLKYLKTCIKKYLVSFKIYKYPSSHPLLTHLKKSILFPSFKQRTNYVNCQRLSKSKGEFRIINFISLKKERKKRRIRGHTYICHTCHTHEFQLRNTIIGTRSTVNKTLKYNIFIYIYNMLKIL